MVSQAETNRMNLAIIASIYLVIMEIKVNFRHHLSDKLSITKYQERSFKQNMISKFNIISIEEIIFMNFI